METVWIVFTVRDDDVSPIRYHLDGIFTTEIDANEYARFIEYIPHPKAGRQTVFVQVKQVELNRRSNRIF